jgi:hypothetical protein
MARMRPTAPTNVRSWESNGLNADVAFGPFMTHTGPSPDSEHCTILCDYNGLDCLTVANGTTGAQRFLTTLSNRGTLTARSM